MKHEEHDEGFACHMDEGKKLWKGKKQIRHYEGVEGLLSKTDINTNKTNIDILIINVNTIIDIPMRKDKPARASRNRKGGLLPTPCHGSLLLLVIGLFCSLRARERHHCAHTLP
jgi:hypothetical protein